ncbi:RagB/SusD family nutrient uptake outer membrane protein [Chitinophaga sp. OAE865]|uniref:RagB/SusD family nutrient uptake outer membrane protein n=1 Tax=Chitinophaga sp. OAE865 TaxID=2817898 RepID=UPI001AE13C09
MALIACNNNEWLDAKRIKSDVKPETLKDFQAILDNNQAINGRFVSTGLAAADNIIISDAAFGTLRNNEKEIYLWGLNPWSENNGASVEWNYLYGTIAYANIVIEGLDALKSGSAQKDNVLGQALFYRSFALYNLALIFCRQYDPQSARDLQGLPLRLSADVNTIYNRSDLEDTYGQIITDAKKAVELLSTHQPFITRPSKLSTYGLLSRVFMSMGRFEDAEIYATHFLEQKSDLLDFNSDKVSATTTYRFPANGVGNNEVEFYAYAGTNGLVRPTTVTKADVDSSLYRSYSDNDLRKVTFYVRTNNNIRFRGGYTGDFYNFCGIATNEILLNKAECLVRSGRVTDAMTLVNRLLAARYKTGTFFPLTATDKKQALDIVLNERRKELPFTFNSRWDDIRRLSADQDRKVEIKRFINGREFILGPASPRYAFPIPPNEIQLSGLEQNNY